MQVDILRRKMLAGGRTVADDCDSHGAPRAWALALARAARDDMALGLDATVQATGPCSLAELLERVPDLSLFAILEGPGDGLGVMVLSPMVLAGLIEVQTLGRVMSTSPQSRRPTRTDAAMVAGWIDQVMGGTEAQLAQDADLPWADGFRYASFLNEARPLGLLLDDIPYRWIKAEASLAMGMKSGPVLLALPAQGRGRLPVVDHSEDPVPSDTPSFADLMARQVMGAECSLQTVIARLRLPLSQVVGFAPGAMMPLGDAAIDRIVLESPDGRAMALGKLGQHRGQRALRLTEGGAVMPAEAVKGDVTYSTSEKGSAEVAMGAGAGLRAAG